MFSLNTILERYFDKVPAFVSIDIEGYEYQVLKDLDFTKWRSQCFCIETGEEQIRDLMFENGYSLYAETPVNWIFVLNE